MSFLYFGFDKDKKIVLKHESDYEISDFPQVLVGYCAQRNTDWEKVDELFNLCNVIVIKDGGTDIFSKICGSLNDFSGKEKTSDALGTINFLGKPYSVYWSNDKKLAEIINNEGKVVCRMFNPTSEKIKNTSQPYSKFPLRHEFVCYPEKRVIQEVEC